jgi:2-aminoadipate transaminase
MRFVECSVAHLTPTAARLAAWLADDKKSAFERTVANPAALGMGRDMIGFGGGQPAVELYPLEALQRAFSRAILEDGPEVLPYGPSEGLPALRQIVARRLAKRGINVSPEHVLVTTGSLQGLHLVGRMLLDHGDTIVTEAPTFMGALTTWEHQQPRYLTVLVDEHGMQVEELETALRQSGHQPKFIYLLPTFQNPSGVSLNLERRRRLLDIAEEHNLFIIEDDPYGEFWFDEGVEPTPPLRSLPGSEDRVIYLGTFSKILAPGIRLAYAVGKPEIIARLVRAKRGVDFHTDSLVQQGVVRLIEDPDWDLEAHVELGRRTYKARRDAMLDALEATFVDGSSWTRPNGGYFLWLDLPDDVSGDEVVTRGLQEGVSVFPGGVFFPNADGGHRSVRLSFSNATPERIAEGIHRLRRSVEAIARR